MSPRKRSQDEIDGRRWLKLLRGHRTRVSRGRAAEPRGLLWRALGLPLTKAGEDRFYAAQRWLQDHLADSIENVISVPGGPGGLYFYRLTSDYGEYRPWADRKMAVVVGMLITILTVTSSIVNATLPTTPEGQQARLIQSTLASLITSLRAL